MRYLWLTLTDPEPRHNGQFLYSGGLIDSMAANGVEMHVLGLTRPESPKRPAGLQDGVHWWLDDCEPRSRYAALGSPLPHVADRNRTPRLNRILSEKLETEPWDAIVFDGISAGWALETVRRHLGRRKERPKLVYISHNHERSLRREIASNQARFLKRQVMLYDAYKVDRLEAGLLEEVDLITAITPEDAERYRAERPDRRVEVLSPGYKGQHAAGRRITGLLPRRAVIVGSFDWIAKRMNLEQFVSVADPLFAERGAELQVIGSAEADFLESMRKKTVATKFTGPVDDIPSLISEARVALVAERHGGGFKLKVLDYIFNRMPILALNGSVAGVPLQHDDSILLFEDYETLARGTLQVLDDYERLNSLQDRAYAACRDQFNWSSRGQSLMAAIAVA